jgi:hypothetical protein
VSTSTSPLLWHQALPLTVFTFQIRRRRPPPQRGRHGVGALHHRSPPRHRSGQRRWSPPQRGSGCRQWRKVEQRHSTVKWRFSFLSTNKAETRCTYAHLDLVVKGDMPDAHLDLVVKGDMPVYASPISFTCEMQ